MKLPTGKQQILNLAAFCMNTRVLGPGIRAALWVQGCRLRCPGCIAPVWIPTVSAHQVATQDLAARLVNLETLDGLTLSGGEPMLQAPALADLVRRIRHERPVNVICFSGYTLRRLRENPPAPGVGELLAAVDVLIDGPYIQEANDDQGLRGSSNQVIHYLSPRLLGSDLSQTPRAVEVHISHEEMLVVGIPGKGVQNALDQFSSHSLFSTRM